VPNRSMLVFKGYLWRGFDAPRGALRKGTVSESGPRPSIGERGRLDQGDVLVRRLLIQINTDCSDVALE
jgi:hypothetical protein